MSASLARVPAELVELVARGVRFPRELRAGAGTASLRQAAVLILFGALDQVPAAEAETQVSADLDVLLLRRSDALDHHPGQVAFPGGGLESQDASPSAAALREAVEETGLDAAGVRVLGRLNQVAIPNSGNLVTPVVAWWSLPSELVADGEETVQVFRVPVAELLDPDNRWTAIYERRGHRHIGPMFRLGPQFGGHVVWGFTAMLLDSIFDALEWTVPWDGAREHRLRD